MEISAWLVGWTNQPTNEIILYLFVPAITKLALTSAVSPFF